MNLTALYDQLEVSVLAGEKPSDCSGVYAGDLLSRAMSHVVSGDLWITIMQNINVIAVASLTDAAAVLLAEGVTMDEETLAVAAEKGVCVLSSPKTVYELCGILAGNAAS